VALIHLVASGLLLNNIYGIGSRRVVIGRLQAVAGEIDSTVRLDVMGIF
jgi:hypothetical protein